MNRRTWFKLGGAAVAGAAALPFLFQRRDAPAAVRRSLVRDPRGIIDLAKGLSYRIIDRTFDAMTDGHRVPACPDGMACFSGPGDTWVLMRNHELNDNLALGPYRGAPVPEAYDPRAAGGVTRIVLDARTGQRVSSNLVLAGTLRNCAGGPSPWGWISCEETTETGHGYAFLCKTTSERVQRPERLTGYGRFRHEAAAVDPRTCIAYLTEDQGDGCLYRFVPTDKRKPFTGRLQALRHAKQANYSVSSSLHAGMSIPVSRVDVPEPDSRKDDLRYQAASAGAATVSRGEGIWFADNVVYICSTDGGKAGRGQILALDVAHPERETLRLLVDSPSATTLNMPDNVTVAPWGDVIVAEDGWGSPHLRGITPRGHIYEIARNAKSQGEFAGVCFSPDGSTLFVNLQLDGLTLAITGTFPRPGESKAASG